jgi:hypothetical protein
MSSTAKKKKEELKRQDGQIKLFNQSGVVSTRQTICYKMQYPDFTDVLKGRRMTLRCK